MMCAPSAWARRRISVSPSISDRLLDRVDRGVAARFLEVELVGALPQLVDLGHGEPVVRAERQIAAQRCRQRCHRIEQVSVAVMYDTPCYGDTISKRYMVGMCQIPPASATLSTGSCE
jgi:hypothetical protein